MTEGSSLWATAVLAATLDLAQVLLTSVPEWVYLLSLFKLATFGNMDGKFRLIPSSAG